LDQLFIGLIAALILIRSPSACSRSPTMMSSGPTARPGKPSLAAGGLAPSKNSGAPLFFRFAPHRFVANCRSASRQGRDLGLPPEIAQRVT
jgi:hypothetical protein